MKILEWKVRDIDLVDSARELQAAVLTLAQTMLKQVISIFGHLASPMGT